ncbi:hypothetical protein ACFSVK_20105 [Azorhizophilus paspali]|uniref:hypothetical protein n=1 Tax=Azorhizophilus paspali TaxID=69963 RepID=UPI00363EF5FB
MDDKNDLAALLTDHQAPGPGEARRRNWRRRFISSTGSPIWSIGWKKPSVRHS